MLEFFQTTPGKWIRGTVLTLMGLAGIAIASRAEETWVVALGIGVLLAAFVIIMTCIYRNVGREGTE